MCIIDKVKGDAKKGFFFAMKSLENNWGRSVLLNFLSTDLYERQGAAQTNFTITLPTPESDLAQELLKSPYDFSSIGWWPEERRGLSTCCSTLYHYTVIDGHFRV